MNLTSGSLSGKNKGRRVAGVGSSPTRSKLWRRLRKLDRKCSLAREKENYLHVYSTKVELKAKQDFEKFDAKRKEVRLKLKGYK